MDLSCSLGWRAATVATYCPCRMVEHLKMRSTQPNCETTRITLYVFARRQVEAEVISYSRNKLHQTTIKYRAGLKCFGQVW